jgi:hypothetical protein
MIVSAVLFALILGAFLFLVLPRARAWQRAASAATFVVLVGVVYGGSVELLSRPKPWRLEWRGAEAAKVLGARLDEGQAIYVWLETPGTPEPRAYVLPWSTEAAQQLQAAMREAEDRGTEVRMARPSGRRSDGSPDTAEPKFYAAPQPPLPDKSYAGADTLIYKRPAD